MKKFLFAALFIAIIYSISLPPLIRHLNKEWSPILALNLIHKYQQEFKKSQGKYANISELNRFKKLTFLQKVSGQVAHKYKFLFSVYTTDLISTKQHPSWCGYAWHKQLSYFYVIDEHGTWNGL